MLMDKNQLLTASVLDIIFEGRNKEYGAYCLRRDYNKRLKTAMLSTGLLLSVAIFIYSFRETRETIIFTPSTIPVDIKPESIEEKPEAIPPPKPVEPPAPVKTVPFTAPLIVDKHTVSPDEAPPANDDLIDAKVDLFKSDGMAVDPSFVPPPAVSKGIIGGLSELKRKEDSIFIKVEVESTYPGGLQAWSRFLNKTLTYPEVAINNGIEGVVVVKFVVDIDGSISRVEPIGGPEELMPEAIRVIKKSGKWIPAVQNGRTVKSYKQQSVSFKLGYE